MTFLNKYLGEEGYEDDEVDIDELNKQYKDSLAKSAYQEFWHDLNEVRSGLGTPSKRRKPETPKAPPPLFLPQINAGGPTASAGGRRHSMHSSRTRFEDNLFVRHLANGKKRNNDDDPRAVVVV